jgi:cysteine-rich repeat protein
MRLPFDQWGGFSPGSTRCQRAIARATAECASAAWAARRACESATLAGQSCDESSTAATIQAARNKSLDTIDEYCSERQAIELQYLGSFDLQADVINFCRAWETAAASAVYGPLAAGQQPLAEQRACAEAVANATSSLMEFIFRNRRQCMDRVAGMALQAPNRTGLLDVAAHRIEEAYTALAVRLSSRCGTIAFAAVYKRRPSDFLAAVGERADCLGAQVYIQDAVLCPAAVCGNGIVEPGEECDDGNTSDGDACPATCVR